MAGTRSEITLAIALTGVMILAVGCASVDPSTETTVCQDSGQSVGAERAASPVLAAGSSPSPDAGRISLFGELGGASGVPFASQAARGLQQHTFTREGGDFDPDIDPTGRLLIFASTRHSLRPDIYVKAIGGSAVTQLTDDPASDLQADISADGKRVAFASDRGGNWDIWITSIDGQDTQQVTKSPKAEVHPSWSSDGQRLVYSALNPKTGQWELWVTDLRQPGTQKFIGFGLFPIWSPTGDVIAFQRARARGSRWFSIWTIRLVDGEPRFPTEVAASSEMALIAPSWTVDGKKIVYCGVRPEVTTGPPTTRPTTRGDVWITDANGRGKICLTHGDAVNYSPVCGPEGRIYFTSNRSSYENIWSIVPVTAPAPMADARAPDGTPTSVGP